MIINWQKYIDIIWQNLANKPRTDDDDSDEGVGWLISYKLFCECTFFFANKNLTQTFAIATWPFFI